MHNSWTSGGCGRGARSTAVYERGTLINEEEFDLKTGDVDDVAGFEVLWRGAEGLAV